MNNAKNPEKGDKSTISMAITLTTGKTFSGKINRIREFHYMLVKLLQSYEHMYTDFHFCCEIFDKGYLETKMHYHGQIEVLPAFMYDYSRFVKEWEKLSNAPMSESKIVFNDKWMEYINKQKVISETYKSLKIPQFIKPKDLKRIRKWSQPSEEKCITDFFGKGEGRRA